MLDRLLSNIAILEPEDGLKEKLTLAEKEGRRLVCKLGFDPTAPDLHLGHAVVLRKLKQFQEAGHHVVIIIGDFTAAIGDPTGRNKMRPPLAKEDIAANSETYISQLGRILDLRSVEVRRNSEWLDRLTLRDMIGLVANVTVAQIMERDDFRKRFQAHQPIHMHELLYPILQAYDSLMIDADIEIGGTDQLFNNLMGRTLQQAYGKRGQAVITMPLLVGTDGVEKMSKTKGNYVGLTDAPESMYGKVMSIPDTLIENYLHLTADFDADKSAAALQALADGMNPMLVKKDIAGRVVTLYHGESAAAQAAAHFERTVQKRVPEQSDFAPLVLARVVAQISSQPTLLDLCAVARPELSRGALRRLIQSGAVRVNGTKILDEVRSLELKPDLTLGIGKRDRFVLVSVSVDSALGDD